MHRRNFLKSAVIGGTSVTLASAFNASGSFGQILSKPENGNPRNQRALRIVSRSLEINKRPAKVFGLIDAQGRAGLTFSEGETFKVGLVNEINEPTTIHWHGLRATYEQDGVPDMPLPLLNAGQSRDYDFPVGPAGTHWMHAHTLQEQNLLAAPLVVQNRRSNEMDEQEVVVLLHDFSFTPASELLAGLKRPSGHNMHDAQSAMSLNDIDYDAYLANDRTLDDPEVVKVESGGRVRLRIINGATATIFTIDTGEIEGELVAVDGKDVEPLRGRRFPMAMGQRIDVRLQLPIVAKPYPILALREGALERTGIILAPPGARIGKLSNLGDAKGPAMAFDLEARLKAIAPLAVRSADRTLQVKLSGGMRGYAWGMTGASPFIVRKGERVHVTMRNDSMMAHPMHLHGHHFQLIGINAKPVSGAVRDTAHIPPMTSVTIAFDADNPGKWAFHCHHLYHMASGMMAMLAYEGIT